jgi:SNF2 family DNA or RNA helicase
MILAKAFLSGRGRWALRCAYDEQVTEQCHKLPGMHFDREARAWVGYLDALKPLIRRLEKHRIAKVRILTPPVQAPSFFEDDDRLRPYQKEGADFIVDHADEGVLLADDLGLGKTRTILCALSELELPAVVVCPAGVKRSWVSEGEKVGVKVKMISGGKVEDFDLDGVVVINYDILPTWLPFLKSAQTVVFDEAHYLINERSRRSRLCKELAAGCSYRIAATATPFTNKPRNLWNVVDTISPGRFGKFFYFAKRYCDAHNETIELRDGDTKTILKCDGATHLKELSNRLKQFTIRRMKADVQLELPPQIRQIVEVDVASDSLAYEWSLKNTKEARIALSAAAKTKIPHAVEMADEVVAGGGHVVVFCHEKRVVRETVRALEERHVPVFWATGELSPERREKAAAEAARAPSALVVTTHSMGVGINYLTYADHAIFLELDYEPHWLIQAAGRLHRQGQRKTVHVRYLVAIGTIDEAIRDAVLNKMDVFERTFGSTEAGFVDDLRGGSEEDSLAAVRDYLHEMGKTYFT